LNDWAIGRLGDLAIGRLGDVAIERMDFRFSIVDFWEYLHRVA
jgi:hypothetical protein